MRPLLPLAMIAVACSPSTPTPDAGSGLTPDQACAAISAARCAKRMACEPATLTVNFGDVTTCTAREKANCLGSISAPGTGNTPDSVKACADAFDAWPCPDWFNNIPPDVCKVKTGSQAKGSPCAFAAQCATGFCAVPNGATCGSCATLPTVGSVCGNGVGCGGNGLYCDQGSQTCQPLVTSPGHVCDAGSCGYLLGCVIPTDGGSGTCQTLGMANATCDLQQHTAATCLTTAGFACVFKHCVADAFANTGQSCGTDRDAGTFTRCSSGGSCQSDDAGVQTCVAAAAEGFDCDVGIGVDCLSPARCVSTNGMASDGGPVLGKCALPSGMTCN